MTKQNQETKLLSLQNIPRKVSSFIYRHFQSSAQYSSSTYVHSSVFYWRDCSRLGVVHFKAKRPIVCTMVSVCCYYASLSLPLKYELYTPIVAKLHTLCYCVNRIILILFPVCMYTLTCLMCWNVINTPMFVYFKVTFKQVTYVEEINMNNVHSSG